MQLHKYSMTELDNMLPYEREIYIQMLNALLEKQKAQKQQG